MPGFQACLEDLHDMPLALLSAAWYFCGVTMLQIEIF